MDNWRALAEDSRHFAECTGRSLPIRRELQQVADLASSLRQRVQGSDFNQMEADATRLLARGGIGAAGTSLPAKRPRETRLKQALGVLESGVQPGAVTGLSHRDVPQRSPKRANLSILDPNVDSRESGALHSMQSLLQRAHENNWNRSYQSDTVHLQARQPFPEHTIHTWAFSGASSFGSENLEGTVSSQLVSCGHTGGIRNLTAKDQAYVDVVLRMIESRTGGINFNAMTEFVEAAAGTAVADANVVACWKALQSMTEELGFGFAAGGRSSVQRNIAKSLLNGARKFLESRNDRGMTKMVQESKEVVLIGGNPDKLHEIQNFVIYKHHKVGKLDVREGSEGLNTSWVQVYYALRSGHPREAIRAAERVRWGQGAQRLKPLKTYIEEWMGENEDMSSASINDLTGVCKYMLTNPSSERNSPFFKYKILTLAYLSGSVDQVDQLSTTVVKPWENLDEWLWFLVSCTCVEEDTGGFTLQKLQNRIRDYPATFYSREGKSPMLYTLVLFASLQFKTAVSFLAQDCMAEKNRSDAVHFALALHHHGIFDSGLAGDAGTSARGVDFAMLVESFGKQFARTDSFLTLDYYLLAVGLKAGDHNVRLISQALRKVIVDSGDIGRLLSNDVGFTADHPIRRFLDAQGDLNNVLQFAAEDCQKHFEHDEAYALYMAAKIHAKALGIINIQIAQILKKWAWEGHRSGDRMDHVNALLLTLARKGENAMKHMKVRPIGCPQCAGFRALESIAGLFRNYFNNRFSDAVSAVQNLDFLPTQSSTPSSVADKCKSLQSADSSLIRILPDVLQVYAWAVVKQYEENPTNPKPTQQIAELAALSRNVPPPFAIGKDVFRELTGLERRLL